MYVYQEYPKCLYGADINDTHTVNNAEEEEEAKEAGWKTADEFHGRGEAASPADADE